MPASVDRIDQFLPTLACVPKGPSGLWSALTAATAHDRSDVVELASVAHLAYLARLAPAPVVVETPAAEVIDLGAYRARRSA